MANAAGKNLAGGHLCAGDDHQNRKRSASPNSVFRNVLASFVVPRSEN
jgi:hypothetical protein